MSVELQNVIDGSCPQWSGLEHALCNGASPLPAALDLIREQVNRAEELPLRLGDGEYPGATIADIYSNREMITKLRGSVNLDHKTDPESQIPGVRTWFIKLRSHLGLILLGNPDNIEWQVRYSIVQGMLSYLPKEEKHYPSDQTQASTKNPTFEKKAEEEEKNFFS